MKKYKTKNATMNHQIQESNMLLILPDGSKYGLVDKECALKMAMDEEMDLVLLSDSSNGKPAVCKIFDYSKEQYRKQKKKKHHHKTGIMKEIQFSLNISDHDLEIKHKKVRNFLEKGQLVRYVMKLKGRQKRNIDYALSIFNEKLNTLEEDATWEKTQKGEGRISTTLTQKKQTQ
jgi:translation initiation factor IF-3